MRLEDRSLQFDALRVELGERGYDIRFFLRDPDGVAAAIKPLCPERAMVVTNDTIWTLHGAAFSAALRAAGIDAVVEMIGDGERFKTLESTSAVLDRMIEAGLGRRSLVIAFGGGVVGDLAGFAAACFLRGIDYVQVPTTVVAMVDSSVGGKTGVDHRLGKNLIGAFWQPRLVAVDLGYLDTLDDHNFRGGFAEIIKYGVIRDPALFQYLESSLEAGLQRDAQVLWRLVHDSCRNKAEVVGEDEREGGLRAILNYGHTFGHAIEAAEHYRERQFHGQAVAIGMVLAGETARRMGIYPACDAGRVQALIERAGLPTRVPDGLDAGELVARMKTDKKVVGGRQRFVLPIRIGEVAIRDDVPVDLVAAVLRDMGAS